MDIRITHVIELSPALMSLLSTTVSGVALASAGTGKPGKPAEAPTTAIPTGGATGDGPQATALKDAGMPAAGAAASDAGPTDNGTLDTGDGPEGIDADGHPFNPALHTGTRTKADLWRMKAGVSRPAPMPGFPKTDAAPTAGAPATENGAASAQSIPGATATEEDEDEFAAFRAAADKASGTDAAAAASVPARKWTDADLGALCNQAAVKFGDPAPVKELIQQFVADGEVPHSRNIADDKREDFAKAVEAKAEITFAG
ncbi:MAG: hypothetical protein H0X34_07020 [Chthoniobacterales bacterium]|nr:hypothetical protein [Chthoniobacterales bacterium]